MEALVQEHWMTKVAVSSSEPPHEDPLPAVGTFLRRLDDETRVALRRLGRIRGYEHRELLTIEGNPSSHVVLVLSGRVIVRKATRSGEQVVLALRHDGDLIGDMAAVSPGLRSATVQALSPVVAFQLEGSTFLEFVHHRPQAVLALLDHLASKLRESDRWRLEREAYDAPTRVLRHTIWMAEEFGGATEDGWVAVAHPLTQADLASWVGTSRETTSKTIADLKARGFLRVSGGVQHLHLDSLREEAARREALLDAP